MHVPTFWCDRELNKASNELRRVNFESSAGGDVGLSSKTAVMACDESRRRGSLHKWVRREGRARAGKRNSGCLYSLAGRDSRRAKETREGQAFTCLVLASAMRGWLLVRSSTRTTASVHTVTRRVLGWKRRERCDQRTSGGVLALWRLASGGTVRRPYGLLPLGVWLFRRRGRQWRGSGTERCSMAVAAAVSRAGTGQRHGAGDHSRPASGRAWRCRARAWWPRPGGQQPCLNAI
jgi:hypothetical protein